MQKVLLQSYNLQADQELIFGSGSGSDVILKSKKMDSKHARFIRRDQSILIQDLNSSSDTFVNNKEVRGFTLVSAGDRIRLGSLEFVFNEKTDSHKLPRKKNQAHQQSTGLTITLRNATKTVSVREGLRSKQQAILDDISVQISPGEFVGILGASGSGKSTLIKVIAGLIGLTDGTVLRDGQLVDQQTLQKDQSIAYLPQDVVIHESLTPLVALGYIVRLKGLSSSKAEQKQIVEDALRRVGIEERMNVPIYRLSGGQRKRVALAAELLGNPQVILLDEATSGLDPATEAEMMKLFRSLADEGKTVICITHFPGRLAMCDRLIYLMKGKTVFYGPPDKLTRFFGTNTIEQVYVKQNERLPEEWQTEFRKTPLGQSTAKEALTTTHKKHAGNLVDEQNDTKNMFNQTRHLLQRYFKLQRADWQYLMLLFAQAPVIALMIAATFGSIPASFTELHAANTKEVIFVLVVAMLWCSGTASVREVVKEEDILRHETRFGVRLVPYLLSKLIVLSAFSLIQAFLLLFIVRHFTEMTGLFLSQFLVLSFTALVGVVLGLFVSSFAGTSERAMTLLPVLLIAQAIFSGGLARLEGWVKIFAQLMIPAYWSLDGFRATFSSALKFATYPGSPGTYQPPILGTGGPLPFDFLALGLQASVLAIIMYFVLHLKLSRSIPVSPMRYFAGMFKSIRKQTPTPPASNLGTDSS